MPPVPPAAFPAENSAIQGIGRAPPLVQNSRRRRPGLTSSAFTGYWRSFTLYLQGSRHVCRQSQSTFHHSRRSELTALRASSRRPQAGRGGSMFFPSFPRVPHPHALCAARCSLLRPFLRKIPAAASPVPASRLFRQYSPLPLRVTLRFPEADAVPLV